MIFVVHKSKHLKQYDQAIKDLNKVIEINPKDADAYYNRGLVYKELGDNKSSREDIKKAKDLGYK